MELSLFFVILNTALYILIGFNIYIFVKDRKKKK